MIKVLQILTSLNCCGGVENYVYNYYKHIDRSRIQFDFLIHGTPETENFIGKVEAMGAKVFVFDCLNLKTIKINEKRFYELLEKNHYDVIHDHMANSAFLYLKVAKKCGIENRVLHSHQSRAADQLSHRIRNKPLLIMGNHWATQRAAVSKIAGDYLFGNKPYAIINNCIDGERFAYSDKDREEIRSQYRISKQDFVIGHIGRMCPQKNQEYLLKILKSLKEKNINCKVLFVGGGEDKERLVEQAKELGVSDFVLFVGNQEDSSKFYSSFDVFVLPSLYEGLPTVGIEALYNGLEIITSDNVTTEMDVENRVAHLSLKDLSLWIDKIVDVYRCGPRNRKIGTSAMTKYNIDIQAPKLLEYYIDMIK